MAISSPGLGSNLDVNSIVSQLMTVERQPVTALNKKEASYQAKLTAYGSIQSAVSSFQSAVSGLNNIERFKAMQSSLSDATVASATPTSSAISGSYAINVTALAQAQKLSSAGFANTTDVVGAGDLYFQVGSGSSNKVTITSANNTLSGIRDAVNAAGVGVSASIINDGSGSGNKLVFTSNSSGTANALKITVQNDGDSNNTDTSGLSQLAYDSAAPVGSGKNLTQGVAAADATLTIDGIAMTKSTNSISDAIQGVTLNLAKIGSTTLTISKDMNTVSTAVQSFVTAYNSVTKSIKDLSSYDSSTKKGGILLGDSTALSIQTKLRGIASTALTGTGGAYNTLSQIGVSFQKDGTLSLDSTKLQNAMNSNFGDIAGLFAALGRPTDSLVSYASSTSNTKPGAYALTVTQNATKGGVTGTGAAGTTIDGTNDTLNVAVDGVNATVTLAAGSYTFASLAAEVQSKINGASAFSSAGISAVVSQTLGVITLTSNRYGSASNVSVTGGNGATNLMGAISVLGTAGLDVTGTINSVAATGSGQYLTGATGNDAEGLKVQVVGGALGSRGTVNFSQGFAYQFNNLASTLLASDGTLSSRTAGINASIKDIGTRREALNRRLVDIEARYRKQFSNLDQMMSSMLKTSSYLTQQFANMTKNNG